MVPDVAPSTSAILSAGPVSVARFAVMVASPMVHIVAPLAQPARLPYIWRAPLTATVSAAVYFSPQTKRNLAPDVAGPMASESWLKGLSFVPLPPAGALALTKTPHRSLTSAASIVGSPAQGDIVLLVVDVYPGHPTCAYLLQSERGALHPATAAAAPTPPAISAPSPTSQSTRRIRTPFRDRAREGPGKT